MEAFIYFRDWGKEKSNLHIMDPDNMKICTRIKDTSSQKVQHLIFRATTWFCRYIVDENLSSKIENNWYSIVYLEFLIMLKVFI